MKKTFPLKFAKETLCDQITVMYGLLRLLRALSHLKAQSSCFAVKHVFVKVTGKFCFIGLGGIFVVLTIISNFYYNIRHTKVSDVFNAHGGITTNMSVKQVV